MHLLNDSVLKKIKLQYGASEDAGLTISLLNRGGFANADVYKVTIDKPNIDLTVKDFSHCSMLSKIFIAPLLVRREAYYLKLLKEILRMDSDMIIKVSNTCLAFPYIEGRSLAEVKKRGECLDDDFFLKLENLIQKIHERSIVHLDTRNTGNIICKDGEPYLIDFQSAVRTNLMPSFLRRLLEESDLSGAYKGWRKCGKNPLPKEKEETLQRLNRIRKYWIFRKKFFSANTKKGRFFSKKNIS